MRLAAIINAWGDSLELLPYCIENMVPLCDEVIVVWSEMSNYGERDEQMTFFADDFKHNHTSFVRFEPSLHLPASENERNRRNYGLYCARKAECTHFLMADSDEFYEKEPFLKEKERFLNPSLQGLVCASQVYFKSPKLTIGLDTTRITFIHKITPRLSFEFNRDFPFAFDKKAIRIDPTRMLNIKSGVEWSDIICHHYSWIRKDYAKKIRNSTARTNIERSTIMHDLVLAKEGAYCNFYGKTLIRASVDFNLPEFDVHEDLQQGSKPMAATVCRLSRD